jgi:hypothetical protein
MKSTIGDNKYTHSKVSEWVDTIGNSSVGQLKELNPNFKYVVSTLIIQKVGSGLHFETVAHWDSKTDGSVMVKFDTEDLSCFCTVLGIAI